METSKIVDKSGRIWVTWEWQRRNRTLSKALHAKLFEFDIQCNRLLRYPIALYKTLITFISETPDIIFVQNPSIILTLFAVHYGLITNIPVIVDAHNAGVYPFNGKSKWANRLAAYLFRRASITIVTNEALAAYVRMHGGNAIVLPDPIPEFTPPATIKTLNGKHNILFVCSWADDEPYDEVIQAARLLDKNICVYITGNSKGKELVYADNIVLTGYLKDEDYINMLYSCDVVMDLTTRADCLVCGAYEALAAEKPLIVSDFKALMEYFCDGVLYTNNSRSDIAAQIEKAIHLKEELQEKIKALKQNKINEWDTLRRRVEMHFFVMRKKKT